MREFMAKNKLNNIFMPTCCFQSNKNQYVSDNKLVLVEGSQDYRLFKRVGTKGNVKFLDIDRFVNDYIRGYFNSNDNSHKKRILHVMSNWRIDGRLFKHVNDLNMYAVVDRDYDDEFPVGKYDRVFSSDAHDLETMLLKTDDELNEKIISLLSSNELLNVAKYMVYQIAIIKKCLHGSNIKVNYNKIKSSDVALFFDDIKLNVKKYVNYLVNNCSSASNFKSSLNKSAIHSALLKGLKKEVDNDGNLRIKITDFTNKQPKDFWEIINGHDFLQIILYLNKKNNSTKELEEKSRFEYFLIDNYNCGKLKNDPLYDKLKSVNII